MIPLSLDSPVAGANVFATHYFTLRDAGLL